MRYYLFPVLLLLSGCISISRAIATDTSIQYVDAPIPATEPGKALVCFYALADRIANGVTVTEDGEPVSAVKPGSYNCINVEPGVHVFGGVQSHKSEIHVTTVEGRRYFVKFSQGHGAWSTKPIFELMPDSTALAAMASLNNSVVNLR